MGFTVATKCPKYMDKTKYYCDERKIESNRIQNREFHIQMELFDYKFFTVKNFILIGF